MEDHFLSLTCPECGAKLGVYDDTDRFTCSYCESDVEIKRRGGTVSLKLLSNARRQVQIGTERNARLIEELTPQIDVLEAQLGAARQSLSGSS